MSINLISGVISSTQLTRLEALINELEAELAGVLMGLTADERRSYAMMGNRTRVIAGHAQAMTQNHPTLFPPSIDVQEFERDLALYDNTTQLLRRLTPLYEKLGDTAIAAGYDAYQAALNVYSFAKIASPHAGVEELVKEMGQQFKRGRRSTPAAVERAPAAAAATA